MEIEISEVMAREETRQGHRNICHLIGKVYSAGDEYSTGDSEVNDVHLFYSPLAEDTLLDLTMSNCAFRHRKLAMLQMLVGLNFMHALGIMHRDIKPTNILVVSYDPIHIAYTDFGCATFDQTPTDHRQGTIAYLAPEILKLKAEAQEEEQKFEEQRSKGETAGSRARESSSKTDEQMAAQPYTSSVDIFALGVSAYQLFLRKSCTWARGINPDTHERMVQDLMNSPATLRRLDQEDDIQDMIVKMIAWKSADRPSTQVLLSSAVWRSEEAQMEVIVPSTTAKRQRS